MGAPDDNVAVTLLSERDDDGTTTGNQGWTSVETVLIRIDTRFTPAGRFPVHFDKIEPGLTTRIGYDAAVCVQKYEPWITETYNTSTGSAFALQIIGGGNNSTLQSPDGRIRGDRISDVTRDLNTTGKDLAFEIARRISYDQLMKLTASRDGFYVPSPTVCPVVPRVESFF